MDEKSEAIEMTADIVSAYVGNNTIATSDLPALIQSVHRALANITAGAEPVEAAPKEPAARGGVLATAFEAVPVGDPHRKIHVGLVGAAVIGHSHCVPVGHRFRADEVLSAQSDPVHADLTIGSVRA